MTPYQLLENLDACPEALKWVKRYPDKSMQDLWDICPRGDWMLWLLANGPYKVSDKLYREMAYEFAAHAVEHAGDCRDVCCDTLEVVSRYIDGLATDDELTFARKSAWEAADTFVWAAADTAARSAARAAADVASDAAWGAAWAAASDAAWGAAWAAACDATRKAQADIIRFFISRLEEVE